MPALPASPWLLLIHQIPPRPAYLRVKIWRRLQRLGAVAIKNSVYALPAGEAAREDLHWVAREIEEGGGSASVCEATFVEGMTDDQIRALFGEARDADYAQVAAEGRRLQKAAAKGGKAAAAASRRNQMAATLARLELWLAEVVAIDFFGASGRAPAESLLREIARGLKPDAAAQPEAAGPVSWETIRGRTWVTRKGVHVDRIASAWLIRRFLDPEARFKFVPASGYRPEPGELRFDMFDAEFTHRGDRCTFEVLLEARGLDDAALRAIAEVVHDIDLKDARHARPETSGIDRLIRGIAMAHPDDATRIERGALLFDDLHASYRKPRG